DHSRPGVGAIWDHQTELKRTKAGPRLGIRLEMVLDLLIDRMSLCPACRRVRPALDVAGKQFDSREQTADSAHVAVAIATDSVRDPPQEQSLVLEWFQRFR